MITQAGDDPKVVGLVYVAAYAPEVGQSANDASSPFGWTEGQKQIRLDSQKFATLTSKGMLEEVTEGLRMEERQLALAVQGQSYGPMFDESSRSLHGRPNPHGLSSRQRIARSLRQWKRPPQRRWAQ